MPKVRCSGCQAVLNAPDAAAGKTLSCPKCQTKIKVPGGKSPPPKTAKPPAAGLSSTMFEKLDLERAQSDDEEDQVCPYCAAEMDPEDPVCRSCGMNLETGVMDPKEAKKRAIKGPDPALFFKNAWGECWSFLMEYKSLAFRTGSIWLMFATIFCVCMYMGIYFCKTTPTKTFWIGLGTVAFLGLPGWFMYLGGKLVQATILREQVRSDRIFFDYFQAVAGGIRLTFWPFVVMGPLTPLVMIVIAMLVRVSGFSLSSLAVVLLAGFTWMLIPVLLLPLAFVHMTAKYTYKAWILWELLKVGIKNAAAVMFLYVMAFVAVLPVLTVALPLWLITKDGNPFNTGPISDWYGGIAVWLMKIMELNDAPDYWGLLLSKALMQAVSLILLLTPFFLMSGFSAVYIMRAIGLFGYYNNHFLDLVQRMQPGTPATFWVRFLAHFIDTLFVPFASFLVTSNAKLLTVQWVINGVAGLVFKFYGNFPTIQMAMAVVVVAFTHWFYWAGQEASSLKGTLGKDAFGLIVENWDEKPMTLKQASIKWFLRCAFTVDLGLPFLGVAVHPDKKCLHDIVTRSRVVWKGDK